jgi:hypothetical protein
MGKSTINHHVQLFVYQRVIGRFSSRVLIQCYFAKSFRIWGRCGKLSRTAPRERGRDVAMPRWRSTSVDCDFYASHDFLSVHDVFVKIHALSHFSGVFNVLHSHPACCNVLINGLVLLGKFTGNPWVFTIKYGVFRLKFPPKPIHWLKICQPCFPFFAVKPALGHEPWAVWARIQVKKHQARAFYAEARGALERYLRVCYKCGQGWLMIEIW